MKTLNVAVILPERYRGGTLRGALNITRMLAVGAKANNDSLRLSFGHVYAPDIYSDKDFESLRALGVSVRAFNLERIPGRALEPLYSSWMDIPKERRAPEYVVFNDGISNFEDADIWVIVSDRLSAPIPPHRKYAVVVYDYIQRYVPEIFGVSSATDGNWKQFEQYASVARNADFVICTTAQTRQDCISYAGANGARVKLFPQEFDPIDDEPAFENAKEFKKGNYILWTTNSTQHKNHISIIAGLDKFFGKNKSSEFKVYMTGVYTHLFSDAGKSDPHYNDPYAISVRKAIQDARNLKGRLKILGNIDDSAYRRKLQEADWLLHGALYDNGTFSIVEAAWYGVPSISSDYPAIRECCKNFGFDVVLFDPYSSDDLAETLGKTLTSRDEWSARLPGRLRLSERTFDSVAPVYWRQFKCAYDELVGQA